MKTKVPTLLVTIDDEHLPRMLAVANKLTEACSGMIMLSFIPPGSKMLRTDFLDYIARMVEKGHAFELSPPHDV